MPPSPGDGTTTVGGGDDAGYSAPFQVIVARTIPVESLIQSDETGHSAGSSSKYPLGARQLPLGPPRTYVASSSVTTTATMPDTPSAIVAFELTIAMNEQDESGGLPICAKLAVCPSRRRRNSYAHPRESMHTCTLDNVMSYVTVPRNENGPRISGDRALRITFGDSRGGSDSSSTNPQYSDSRKYSSPPSVKPTAIR